jgi:ubiquinone/menaquinone biosynthesis C-methylase UbiE
MDSSDIHKHWTDWATKYGTDLRATTRSVTPKILEIDALKRHFGTVAPSDAMLDVLEVGCGNGVNCFALAEYYPNFDFHGVDFVQEMVTAATEKSAVLPGHRPKFFTGNVLELGRVAELKQTYDIVFTDRCIINLNTLEQQLTAITALTQKLRVGGHLILIENSTTTYGMQNRCRELLGLQARTPASFNLFFDESAARSHATNLDLELMQVEDFGGLHDLLLYALVPAINGGTVDYEHPIVKAAVTLSMGLSANQPNMFGPFGQNRLFHWKKIR